MLSTRREDRVSILTLQREHRRNALDLDLCTAIHETVDREVDAGARVLVVTGEGSSFCSGADLGGVYGDAFLEALYGMLHRLTALPVPLIAAVNGPAIGAGTQLAMACDLRVAAATARFAVPTARNGMAVDAWTIRTLAALAGHGPARRLMLAAEQLDVEEATATGLVDRRGDLGDAVAWAHEIAALAPLTLAHNKLVLNADRREDRSPSELDDEIGRSFSRCWSSADVAEAAAARSEKRVPAFEGH
ncbi:enoyl-CoA hydratase [Nocardioidaceae bacterium]|nr:enoyl-CoA hydratase [Nocardioidaceae bacterium]